MNSMMDQRSQLAIWLDATERYLVCRTLSKWLPLYVVAEYPKSGGTWLCQMLAAALEVPFPRNRRIRYTSCVVHGHYVYSDGLFSKRPSHAICMIRDGRDIMVSLYFHSLFENERTSPHVVRRTRSALAFQDCEDVSENLPKFIEYVFDRQRKSRSPFQFTWPQFVRSWSGRDVGFVKYEELIHDTLGVLRETVERIATKPINSNRLQEIVDEFSFAKQASREPGVEKRNSFLRKGVAGDWQNNFSIEARRVFDELAGEELILLGYESNRSWVDATSNSTSVRA